jgi:hypothetical protein
MKKLEWHTEKRKIKELVPTKNNPRQMTDKQRSKLEESLKKFNLVEIPAINTDNKIIAGHQRLKILQILGRGEEEIEVRVPNRKLSKKEHEEYMIRSNKNTGDWDFDALANEFEIDFLEDVGFENLEMLIDGVFYEDESLLTKSCKRGGISTDGIKVEIGQFVEFYPTDSEGFKKLKKIEQVILMKKGGKEKFLEYLLNFSKKWLNSKR